MKRPAGFLLVALGMLLAPRAGAAQADDARATLPFVVRVGAKRDAAVCVCSKDGQPAPNDRDFYMMTMGTEWPVAGRGAVRLSYAADVIPLVLSKNTADDALSVWSCGDGRYCGSADAPYPWRTSAVGAGLMPIGFVLRARPAEAFAVRARLSGGAVYLSRPVPVMQSRNLNFVAELGVGAELRVRHGLSLSAGVTQNHISNANTAPVNLGMDTRLLELGLTFSR